MERAQEAKNLTLKMNILIKTKGTVTDHIILQARIVRP